jgi:hypothetical protein
MAPRRIQVYLTPEQRRRIDELAASRGLTSVEVVRLALDTFLGKKAPSPEAILESTFGALPDLEPHSGQARG